MTKEELKKEAEEYAEGMVMYYESAHGSIPSQFEKYLRNAFLASAEPREKQIQIDAEQIRALQKQNGELTDKVKELEAQIEQEKNLNQCLSDHNEQLRKLIEKMKCCTNCKHSRTEYEHCKTDKHEKWEIKEK